MLSEQEESVSYRMLESKLHNLVAVVQYVYSWAICTCPVVGNAFRWSYFLLVIVISYMIGFSL